MNMRKATVTAILILLAVLILPLIFGKCTSGSLPAEVTSLKGNKLPGGDSIEEYNELQAFENKYGKLETLSGTDNQTWIVYFPKGNFTLILDKETRIVQSAKKGKRPK